MTQGRRGMAAALAPDVRLAIHIAKSVFRLLIGPETTPSALPVPVPVTSSAVRALRPPPGRGSRRFQ